MVYITNLQNIELDIPFLNLMSTTHLEHIPADYLAPLPLPRMVKLDKMPTIPP